MWRIAANRRGWLIAGALGLAATQALAQKNFWDITEADLRVLPPFCRTGAAGLVSYGVDRAEAGVMNHLCPGLNALNYAHRSLGNNPQRSLALQEAIDHFNYTLRAISERNPLRSTILIKRGNALEMQGSASKAITDYHAAIKANQKNLNGYAALSDAYLKIGDRTSALSTIEDGLKVSPQAKPLLARKQKLSGK